MGVIPTIPTTAAGQLVTAGQLQSMENAIRFLMNPPRCMAYQINPQTVAQSTWTGIILDGESYDTDGMHSTSASPTRITIQTPGNYLIYGNVNFGTLPSGFQANVQIRVNGGAFETDTDTEPTSASGSNQMTSDITSKVLRAGDYVEIFAWSNNTGGFTTVASTGGWRSSLNVRWVAGS